MNKVDLDSDRMEGNKDYILGEIMAEFLDYASGEGNRDGPDLLREIRRLLKVLQIHTLDEVERVNEANEAVSDSEQEKK